MSSPAQDLIKKFLIKLGEDLVDGIQQADIYELITVLKRQDAFTSLMTQAAAEAFVDGNGQIRSLALEAILGFAFHEPTRLGQEAKRLADLSPMGPNEKADVVYSLQELKRLTDKAVMTLAQSRFWKKYPGPNDTVPVLSAWLTDKGEAVGVPAYRNMQKGSAIFLEKCYLGVMENESGTEAPTAIFVVPQSEYRMDDSVGAKVRQEFVLNVGSLVVATLHGPHKDRQEESKADPDPKLRKYLPSTASMQQLHKMFEPIVEMLEAANGAVKSMAVNRLITDYEDYSLYEHEEIEYRRSEPTAEENPEAVFEIGAFS